MPSLQVGLQLLSHSGAGLAPPLVCDWLIDWLADTAGLGCPSSGLGDVMCRAGHCLTRARSDLPPLPPPTLRNISRYQSSPASDTREYPGILSLLSGGKEERGNLSYALLCPEWAQRQRQSAEFSSTLVSVCSPQLWPFPPLTHTYPRLSVHLPSHG